jgi:hypothetical protein
MIPGVAAEQQDAKLTLLDAAVERADVVVDPRPACRICSVSASTASTFFIFSGP